VVSSCLQATWQWQNSQATPYLTCSLLQKWPHGFFTRLCYGALPEQLVNVLDPTANVYRLKQVHGALVWTPQELSELLVTDSLLHEGDGLITDSSKQSVWVASADCTPVLVGDLQTGRSAAVHAGWRGTAKGIIPVTISRFLALGSRLEDLRVALGPAITGSVYQVGQDVALEVGSSIFSENILEHLWQLSPSPLLSDLEVGKVRLDVRCVNLHQLKRLGLQAEQISLAPYCTYQNSDYFFSYRRTGEKQVQWSGIISL
jgi:polyphenol oxidase